MEHRDESEQIHIVVRATLTEPPEVFTLFAEEQCQRVVREEPGTLNYGWFLPADGGIIGDICVVEERYADDAAFLNHMDLLRIDGRIQRLVKLLRVDEVFVLRGNADLVSAELSPLKPIALQSAAAI
jgi:quinol monooxygenase YgiN